MGGVTAFLLIGVFIFQQIDFIGPGIHFQNTRLELIGSVFVDGKNAGLGAKLQKLYRIPYQDPPAGLGTLGLGLMSAELFLRLIQRPPNLRLTLVQARGVRAVLELLAQGLQFLRRKIRRGSCFLDNALGLPPG